MLYCPDETFREIRGTDGKYFVSDKARILSLCYTIPTILKPQKHHKDNYYYV